MLRHNPFSFPSSRPRTVFPFSSNCVSDRISEKRGIISQISLPALPLSSIQSRISEFTIPLLVNSRKNDHLGSDKDQCQSQEAVKLSVVIYAGWDARNSRDNDSMPNEISRFVYVAVTEYVSDCTQGCVQRGLTQTMQSLRHSCRNRFASQCQHLA